MSNTDNAAQPAQEPEMTDPTEAIRKALEAYEAAFASGADQQTRSKAASFLFDELSSLTSRQVREIFDRLDSAERDQRRYQWLRDQDNEDFTFAVIKNPHFDVYESPEELDAAIDAALRVGAVGEQKEPT